jgi:hypothetical protein
LVALLLVSGVTSPPVAFADEPSPAALAAARELFREATVDADAGNFEVALEKFKRVAATKDTASVRFNIAKCEQGLGKLAEALFDFETAERAAQHEKKGDIAKLAKQHAASLRPRVPHLVLVAPSPTPKDLTVSLDGNKLASASLGLPLPVDPGAHKVEAAAPGHVPFKREITLKERDEQRVALELAAEPPLAHPDDTPEVKLALEAPPPPPPSSGAARRDAVSPEPAAGDGASRKTWGFVTMGAGAALAITGVVVWRVHESQIDELEAECPGGRCPSTTPPARQAELKSQRDGASTTSAVSSLLVIGGGLAIAAGAALVLWPSKKANAARVVPIVGPGTAGAAFGGSF